MSTAGACCRNRGIDALPLIAREAPGTFGAAEVGSRPPGNGRFSMAFRAVPSAQTRREPAARPRSRHAHGAAAAHRLPGPRRGRRPTVRAAQPHQDHLSRHVPAARLRDPARPRPRKPIRAFQKLTLKCYENGKSDASAPHHPALRRAAQPAAAAANAQGASVRPWHSESE